MSTYRLVVNYLILKALGFLVYSGEEESPLSTERMELEGQLGFEPDVISEVNWAYIQA